MQCRSVELRIQQRLDDRLEPTIDSELIEHAASCPECRELLDAQEQLLSGVPLLEVPTLSADFSQRVVGIVVSQQQRPARRFAPVAAFLAIVATLLLVVALGPQRRTSIGPADDAGAVASVGTVDLQAMHRPVAGFDSQELRIVIEQLMSQFTSVDGASFYQVDQLAGTIRPLATTLNVAFDAIRRTIPTRRQPVRPEPQASDVGNLWAMHVI